jgi:hypothetical protein
MIQPLFWVRLLTAILLFAGGRGLVVLAQEPAENRAGLVIVFGPDEVDSTCVTLPAGRVTGLDVLTESGIAFQTDVGSAVGVGVCKIGETGCDVPLDSCFCRCQGVNCAYWNYLRHSAANPEATWEYSSQGGAATVVQPGDVEVWAWGNTGVEVPFVPFADICPDSTTEPVPTDTPAAVAVAAPTESPTALANEPAAASPTEAPLPATTNCVSGFFSLALIGLMGTVVLVRRRS